MYTDELIPNMLSLAKKMALQSEGEYRLGSVLVKSGRVLAKGVNKYNAINALAWKFFGYQTIHAEIDAMNKVWDKRNIRGSVLYVFRTRKNGDPGNSRPCVRCQNALKTLGVHKIVYSIPDYPYFNVEKV